jgi:hypothetical protein
MGKTVSLAPLSSAGMLVRHCSYQAFVGTCPCDGDFDFTAVKGINGAAGSVSFQSVNFPTRYLAATPAGAAGSEKDRVTLNEGSADKDSASWAPVAGLSDPSKFSFKSLSKNPLNADGYLTADSKSTGTCAGNNKGDVVVSKAPTAKAAATWETHAHPPPPPRPPPPPPPRSPWGTFSSPGAVGTAAIVATDSFHGKDSPRR